MPTPATTVIKASLIVLAGGFAAQHSRVLLDSAHSRIIIATAVLLFLIGHVRSVALSSLGCFLFGYALFLHAGAEIVESRMDAMFAGDSMLVQVRIIDFPKRSGRSVAMLIEPTSDTRLPTRSRITWFDPSELPELGDIWEFELRLRRPRGNSNRGVFNLENWMFRERLHAHGYVVSGNRNRLISKNNLSFIAAYRRNFVDRAKAANSSAAPILAAIGVGARHLVHRDQWDRYARSGTSHLMAISGLHIGLAAVGAYALIALLCGVIRIHGNHLDFAAVGAVISAAGYAFVSGLAVPSQRATLMLVVASIALLSRRRPDPMRIVALVAIVVYIADPISLLAPGFTLSFAAVIALLWFSRRISRPGFAARAIQLMPMQLTLLFGLMPLTVLFFQRIAFIAPVVNLLTVPVFSFLIVPLTLLSMLVNPLWESLGQTLLTAAATCVLGVEFVIEKFSALPFADTVIAGVSGMDSGIWVVVLLPAFLVMLPRAWPGRWIGLVGVLALLLYKPAAPPGDCFDAHILDVGQGLSVVVRSRRHTLIFDTGASYRSGSSAAQQIVLPFLKYLGTDRIDWLVVSHSDDDHAGGVADLISNTEIGAVFAGEELDRIPMDVTICQDGRIWRVDGIEFRILHPGPDNTLVGNDSSCVLLVSAGEHRLLLTGDIEAEAENQLMQRWPRQDPQIVVIPHHGSLTSSSPSLVNQLRPEIAIASVGHDNRWGFPKERVVRRWEGVGATVVDTASGGAVSLRVCASDGIHLMQQERLRQQRFWHDNGTL